MPRRSSSAGRSSLGPGATRSSRATGGAHRGRRVAGGRPVRNGAGHSGRRQCPGRHRSVPRRAELVQVLAAALTSVTPRRNPGDTRVCVSGGRTRSNNRSLLHPVSNTCTRATGDSLATSVYRGDRARLRQSKLALGWAVCTSSWPCWTGRRNRFRSSRCGRLICRLHASSGRDLQAAPGRPAPKPSRRIAARCGFPGIQWRHYRGVAGASSPRGSIAVRRAGWNSSVREAVCAASAALGDSATLDISSPFCPCVSASASTTGGEIHFAGIAGGGAPGASVRRIT